MMQASMSCLRAAGWLLGLAFVVAACGPEIVPPPEPPVPVRRGDELYRYREYEAAIDAYQTYLNQTPHGAYAPRVFYKSAMAAYQLENYHETLSILDELQEDFPTNRWVQVDALRGDAERQLGNQMRALQAYEKAWEIAGANDRSKLRLRIVSIARELDSVELARAQRLLTNPDVQSLLNEEIARRNAPGVAPGKQAAPLPLADLDAEISDEGVAPKGSRAAASAKYSAPPAQAAPTPRAVRPAAPADRRPDSAEPSGPWTAHSAAPFPAYEPAGPEQPVKGVVKIGGLFPLMGSARDRAERSLRAIHLVFGENPYRLELKDTGGNPLTAVAALDDLARDPNVLAVIGPLRNEDAEAVAPEAERDHLPVLLLSHDETTGARYVVQAGLSRSSMVSSLLEYVINRVRLSRFGVLYPDDPAGKALLSTFRTEAERRGGTIVGTATYRPASKNLGVDKGAVMNWRDKQNLQAIFLADGAASASDVARMLQREMPDVTLLGVSDWQEIADHAGGGAVDGVLFADGFYARSTRPATQEFITRFEAAYGYTPGTLEAQAYDAALLVKRALDAGARSRSEVMRHLHSGAPLAGATGDLRVTPAGLQSNLFLLQVYNGRVQEVGGSEG